MSEEASFTAFVGQRRWVTGSALELLEGVKARVDAEGEGGLRIFEDATGRELDVDWRGSLDEVMARARTHPSLGEALGDAVTPAKRGPGRPRLGVVGREVSLLPRHWEWLERRPGGVSAALRRVVDEARRATLAEDRARLAREAAGKFMWTMAGDLPGFEEASRALYARDGAALAAQTHAWPADVRDHLWRLVDEAVRREAEVEGAAAAERA